MRRDLGRIVLLGLVIIALGYVLHRIGVSQVLSVLPRALRPELVIVFSLFYFNTLVRGFRWRLLLSTRIKILESFRYIFLTNFFNVISPVRFGDLWRIKECKKYGLGRTTAAIITEKVIDVSAIAIIVLGSLSLLNIGLGSQIQQGVIGAGVMVVVAFVALNILRSEMFWKLASKFAPTSKEAHVEVREFLRERKKIGAAFILTFLIWSVDLFNFWIIANMITGVSAGVAVLALLTSSLLGSSMITQFGVAQMLVLILALKTLGVNSVDAGAISILFGSITTWVQIPIGYLIHSLDTKK